MLADTTQFADDVTYVVTGSIENVYASLVVLLGYTNVLRRKDQWRNQALYELDQHLLHFRQERPRDDRLEIVLSYPDGVPASAKRVFQGLVEQFLQRRQVAVRMYPRVACPDCGHVLPRAQVIQFIDEGTGITYCPRGGHPIPLVGAPERVVLSAQERQAMAAEAAAAAERTAFTVVATQLRGYLTEVAGHRQPLVVFVSYAWGDPATESWVRDRLVPDLEQAGIEVVLDRTSSRVGGSLSRFVERALDRGPGPRHRHAGVRAQVRQRGRPRARRRSGRDQPAAAGNGRAEVDGAAGAARRRLSRITAPADADADLRRFPGP